MPDQIVAILRELVASQFHQRNAFGGPGEKKISGLVIESLRSAKELRIHDPYIDEISGLTVSSDARKTLAGADLAIFMVAHKEYGKLTPSAIKKLMRTPVVVDGRNLFSMEKITRAGVVYTGIGKKTVLACKASK